MTVDLSAFYADVSKDRLYTFAADSPERRSAQTSMHAIADGLSRLLAPILPVTADEVWRHLPGTREASVHIAEFPARPSIDAMMNADLLARWDQLIAVRSEVNRVLEMARQEKTIGTSLAAHVTLRARGETAALLDAYRDQLPMLFIVSQTTLVHEGGEGTGLDVGVARAEGEKCPRCWRTVASVSTDGLCERCVGALAAHPS
jgi:isoleucyl-tRNA synthetase